MNQNMKTLQDLFVYELRGVYDAERRLVNALSELEEAASSPDLKRAFHAHLEETEIHVDRLEQIFGLFDLRPKAESCESVKGMIKDAERVIDLDAEPDVRDAALAAVVQEIEHFEIAAYGTLRTWAIALDKTEAKHLLDWTLEEEKREDALLTQIADSLNMRAVHH
jgi:ferritin-like metal-binding protein YciE